MPTSRATTRVRRSLGIAAVTVVMFATTACQQDDPQHPAVIAATAYMEAIADGDAGAANALSTVDSEYPLPADDSLDGVETITDIQVGDVPDDADYLVDVPVSYSLGSERYDDSISLTYEITPDENDVEPYRVSSGLDHRGTVNWTGFARMAAPWRDISVLQAGSNTIEKYPGETFLYPGIYDVTADLGPYAELATTTVAVAPFEVSSGLIEAQLEVEVAPSEQLFVESGAVFTASLESIVSNANEYAGQGRGNWVAVHPTSTGAMESEESEFIDSLGIANIEWSILEPVTVAWEQPGDYTVRATAVLRATWSNDTGSGIVDVPVWNTSWAYPEGDGLNVLPPSWTQGE